MTQHLSAGWETNCSVLGVNDFGNEFIEIFCLCFSTAQHLPGPLNERKWKATALNAVIKSDISKRINLI